MLGFAVPVAAYFIFIDHYGVNTIWLDQWYDINLVGHPLSLSALWAQHSEHRVFFPNLVVLLLAHTTHLNVVFEEFVSGMVLCISGALIVLTDKREAPSTPWLYYCPVAFVLLSFVQAGSTLFGFQLSWYMGVLGLAAALFLLDRAFLTTLALVGAIVAAVVGSYSVFEGLFIWLVGLIVLYHRRCAKRVVVVWIASAVVTAAVFFHDYSFQEANSYWLDHPITAIKFFFLAIGDVTGARLSNSGNDAVVLFGLVIFAVACWVIVMYGIRRDGRQGSSVGVALICFGLLFTATFTVGRVRTGLALAGASQYATFDLLILVGCYLALLHPPASLPDTRSDQRAWPVLRAVIVAAVVLQVLLGTVNGLSTARTLHNTEIEITDITANAARAPDAALTLDILQTPGWIRRMIRIAATDHLSLFATAEAGAYRKEGLFPSLTAIRTGVLVPANGARLSGTAILDAGTQGLVPTTHVAFSLATPSGSNQAIGTASPTPDGWILHWDTTQVPNGNYRLRAVAEAANGTHTTSAAITISVRNSSS